MAELTKTQAKKKINELKEQLSNLLIEAEELQQELEEEMYSIEPYDGKSDLTSAQQIRYDWFETASSQVESCISDLSTIIDDLEDI